MPVLFSPFFLGDSKLRTCKTDEIVVIERQRKHFNKMAMKNLATSIHVNSLLHPIVVRESEGKLILVAGERRLRAIQQLYAEDKLFDHGDMTVPFGEVPYTLISDTEEIRLREMELDENIVREDLSWQERTAAIEELHNLRQAQNPTHTMKDTAREIMGKTSSEDPGGEAKKAVKRSVLVAPFLDDPEVARARDENEAYNIVTRRMEAEFVAELNARKVRAAAESQAKGETTHVRKHSAILGDMAVELPKIPSDTFSIIIADPPYGVGADDFGDAAKKAHYYEDDFEAAQYCARVIATEGFRVAAEQAHLYMFCDVSLFQKFKIMFKQCGWYVFRTPLIWIKSTSGHAPIGAKGFRRKYEMILFASKGNKPFERVTADCFEIAKSPRQKTHAAEKPVELYEYLLKLSAIPGDEVLDPCMGSGPIFEAAARLHLIATGIEKEKIYHDQACARLHAVETGEIYESPNEPSANEVPAAPISLGNF